MSLAAINYQQTVQQSNLLEPPVLAKIVEELESQTGVRPISGEKLSKVLLERKLITQWQHEKLQQGLYQGFFIGKYKLLDHLGSGGMGDVYLAEHGRLQRRSALKVLPKALTENQQLLKRFYQEARATAALDHPNIVRAFDVDEENGVHFLVMEFVQGDDLQKVVEAKGPLSYHDAVEYIRQAAEGLAHAHERGMVHRDIKPSNLFLEKSGIIKVLDLGVARIMEQGEHESLTLAGNEEVLGTVDYLAPEQLVDPHRVDGRADLYSLGCTLFFLLVGRAPFADGSMAQRLMAHQVKESPNIRDLRPNTPADLAALLKRMLNKNPDDRFESAKALADELAGWLNEHSDDGNNPGSSSSVMPLPKIPGPKTLLGMTDSTLATQNLLSQLVLQNVLTQYQVEAMYGRSKDPLQIGPYTIRDRIQDGRLGGFYLGRHQVLTYPVTLKIVKLQGSAEDKEKALARFQREARIAIQVNHPHVVRTYEIGRKDEFCFLAFEELKGQSLKEWMESRPRCTLQDICRMLHEAALGLAHLHEHQIVHRDLNPNNLWVTEDRHIKLFDFGLARDALHFLDDPCVEAEPSENEYVGTADYLAPEQAMSSNNATSLSDIYSLGCTLYHVLSGRVPFKGDNPTKKMMMHAMEEPVPPSKINPSVLPELDEVVSRMMAKNPAKRCQSAFIVSRLLQLFMT